MPTEATRKLYYADSLLFSFRAKLVSVENCDKGTALVLDATAFFPEGGGQKADTGFIAGLRVTDVQEKSGTILHFVDIEGPCPEAGEELECVVDSEQRLRRMQNHSGEHIVSGLVHNLFGYDNVGFHMGESCMTIDFSGELSWEELMKIETLANETVRRNAAINTLFPEPSELSELEYRSKLELTENVRIVEIEGVDRCACCAPHVKRTGEVGLIKILGSMKHRGGVRVELVCGLDALDAVRGYQKSVTEISGLLSAKREETAAAAKKLLEDRDALRFSLTGLEAELSELIAEAAAETDGNICIFRSFESDAAVRNLVNALTEKCGGAAAVFSGSDETGYRYVIGSKELNLREKAAGINAAISGRGGGKPSMISGSASAARAAIEDYFRGVI